MKSIFLNRLGAAAVLSLGMAGVSWAAGSAVVPDTAPAHPAFSVPGMEKASAEVALKKGNAERGAVLAQQFCGICHQFKAGQESVGPDLAGIAGRKIASVTVYSYSPALVALNNQSWTDQKLSDWLTSPMHFAPGTRMSFPGLPSADQRADLIAFLHTLGHADEKASPPAQ